MPKLKLALHWQILIAVALAGFVGWLAGPDTGIGSMHWVDLFDFVGTLFINALKMLILPLIASSMITGIAGVGKGIGKLGGRTLLFYAATTLIAVLIGLSFVNLIRPGFENGAPVGDTLSLEASRHAVAQNLQAQGSLADVAKIFERMIPPNVLNAATDNGQILGVIFFSLLFGFFLTRVDDEYAEPVWKFWQGTFEVMMKMTEWIMKFAPIGVFGLVASVIAKAGFDAARPLLVFSVVVLLALATHMFLVMPLLLRVFAKVKPYRLFRYMAPALLTAFSTASSSATLPVTMDCVENAGVSRRTSSFVLPLGATVNMNGTALYECAAVIFLAQAYGVHLSFATQFLVVLTAVVTSVGVAGIPSASLVAIMVILPAVGLPAEAAGVLFIFDRILDMSRTAVNVFGDSACATIVAHQQGETGLMEEAPGSGAG